MTVHPTAQIGNPPEHRDWAPGVETCAPSIHPEATVNAFVTIDAGIGRGTRIGKSFVMAHCHVGHDAVIGDGCELAPGTVIGGHAVLEDGVRCGIGVLVLPFKRIGKGARLGAGAVVTKDVPAGEVWVGNPARKHVTHDWPSQDLTQAEVDGWEEWFDASRGALPAPEPTAAPPKPVDAARSVAPPPDPRLVKYVEVWP